MNTLYVSDLDGTLLNSEKKVSDKSVELINQCIEKGMQFTVATARMPYGCDYMLQSLNLQTLGILMNGVIFYDFSKEKVIMAESILKVSAKNVIEIFKKNKLSCFVYLFNQQGINIYYDDEKLEEQTQYYSEKALKKCGEVRKVQDYDEVLNQGEVIYITYTGKKEILESICRQLQCISNIDYSFYLNVYNGLYCLEIFSNSANKKNALLKLKKMKCYDEIVVFGDNLNDVSMIEIADRSYAPENALPEVKQIVNRVLLDCDHDGVANFLAEEWNVK